SVCSRSSLETTAPEPARRWPIASSSSMKMMAGARLRASLNRSPTRAAPTPTNSPTKLDPATEKNGTAAPPATAPRMSGLAGPGAGGGRLAGRGRPTQAPRAGGGRPGALVPVGFAREAPHSGDPRLGALVAAPVGDPRLGPSGEKALGRGRARPEHALQLPG